MPCARAPASPPCLPPHSQAGRGGPALHHAMPAWPPATPCTTPRPPRPPLTGWARRAGSPPCPPPRWPPARPASAAVGGREGRVEGEECGGRGAGLGEGCRPGWLARCAEGSAGRPRAQRPQSTGGRSGGEPGPGERGGRAACAAPHEAAPTVRVRLKKRSGSAASAAMGSSADRRCTSSAADTSASADGRGAGEAGRAQRAGEGKGQQATRRPQAAGHRRGGWWGQSGARERRAQALRNSRCRARRRAAPCCAPALALTRPSAASLACRAKQQGSNRGGQRTRGPRGHVHAQGGSHVGGEDAPRHVLHPHLHVGCGVSGRGREDGLGIDGQQGWEEGGR